MTLDEKMQKLYKSNKEGKRFTTIELKGMGFHSNEITRLNNSGVLKRVSRGVYALLENDIKLEAGKPKDVEVAEPKLSINARYMNEIFFSLTEGNMNLAISLVSEFLEKIGQSKYEFLILDLIRLSVLTEDLGFTNVFMTLSFMTRGIFSFDVLSYVGYYYESLMEGNKKDAKVYLDIIIRSEELNRVLLGRIKQALETDMDIDKIRTEKVQVLSSLGVQNSISYEEYMISELDTIMYAILEDGNDILGTCLQFELNFKQINFVKLKVAEEYLMRGYKDMAQALINEVRTSPNLDEALLEMLDSIKSLEGTRA